MDRIRLAVSSLTANNVKQLLVSSMFRVVTVTLGKNVTAKLLQFVIYYVFSGHTGDN